MPDRAQGRGGGPSHGLTPRPFEIRSVGPEAVDGLEPLWLALVRHHRDCHPGAAEVLDFRSPEESWRMRRARYELWLREPDARLFLALRGDRSIGYALVRARGPEATLTTGDRVGELESLCVAPDERGGGVGHDLMQHVLDHLRSLGVTELSLGVMDGNADALRFYERHGLRRYMLLMMGPVT